MGEAKFPTVFVGFIQCKSQIFIAVELCLSVYPQIPCSCAISRTPFIRRHYEHRQESIRPLGR